MQTSQANIKPRVGGVIVAYHPDQAAFQNVVSIACQQLDCLVIVNNSEKKIDFIASDENTETQSTQPYIIENKINLGIAKALNIGLAHLISLGCTHFLLLDHDSIMPLNMVNTLAASFIELSKHHHIAAIGPAYFNSQLKKFAPFISYGDWRLKKLAISSFDGYVETHFLISSGTLISLEALNNVGEMQEDLFIDYVDTEWCLRAISKGYKIFGTNKVVMEHALGDTPMDIWGYQFPLHSPLRHYYLVRNAIQVAKKDFVPPRWKFVIISRMMMAFCFYAIAPANRVEHFKKMLSGFRDGLSNKLGQYK